MLGSGRGSRAEPCRGKGGGGRWGLLSPYEEAAKSWRRIRAPEKVAELLAGTRYRDGTPVTDDPPEQQREAA